MNPEPIHSFDSKSGAPRKRVPDIYELSHPRPSASGKKFRTTSGDLTVIEEADLLIERLNSISHSFFERFRTRESRSADLRLQQLGRVAFLHSVVRSTMVVEKTLLGLSKRKDISEAERIQIQEMCSEGILVPVHWIFEMVSLLIDKNPVEMPEEFYRFSNKPV